REVRIEGQYPIGCQRQIVQCPLPLTCVVRVRVSMNAIGVFTAYAHRAVIAAGIHDPDLAKVANALEAMPYVRRLVVRQHDRRHVWATGHVKACPAGRATLLSISS